MPVLLLLLQTQSGSESIAGKYTDIYRSLTRQLHSAVVISTGHTLSYTWSIPLETQRHCIVISENCFVHLAISSLTTLRKSTDDEILTLVSPVNCLTVLGEFSLQTCTDVPFTRHTAPLCPACRRASVGYNLMRGAAGFFSPFNNPVLMSSSSGSTTGCWMVWPITGCCPRPWRSHWELNWVVSCLFFFSL